MRIGIVGGGILGLTLGYRLGRLGHEVTIFEASPEVGGLAAPTDYGPFVWDRYYHCILPTDTQLVALLREIGMGADLRWKQTGTGYYARGKLHSMSSNWDFLRFPLLSIPDKARLGAAVVYATRFADPWELYRVTAAEWLTRVCGRRGYEVFWRPLLKAKFGPYHDRVAAVFIWATLTRLYGARSAGTSREKLGYASGGYARILDRLGAAMRELGVKVHTSAPVVVARPVAAGSVSGGETGPPASASHRPRCELAWRVGGEKGEERRATFDQVFFTGPTRLARRIADDAFVPHVEKMASDHPTSESYLGVACLVLVLRRALTPFYVLNIGEESIELTGLIEMTNLVDRAAETKGLSLVYLPQYMDSADPRFEESGAALADAMMSRGVERLFGRIEPRDIVYRGVHRARYVQPLPLARAGGAGDAAGEVPALERPFQVLNTSMLTCATLNNNEVVGLVNRFVDRRARAIADLE